MFSSGLEIFSTFNIHLPVNGCPFHVCFNLTKSTTVNYITLAGPVRPANTSHLAEKKVSQYFKKIFKKPTTIPFADDY